MTFQPNFVKFTNTDVIGTEPLEGRFKGNQNDGFTYVRFADGSGGIIKTMKNWVGNKTGRLYPAEILAAQEYLASLVGETMNAPVRDCHFYGSGAKTVIMPFIVGQTGEEAGQTELPENAQGTALKLFDYLTANADRRPKNWISTPDGRIVGIDHALCNFRPRVLKPDFVSDLWNNGVSPESLLILQPKLANLAIDFHQIGMGDKHETMMQNLSQLIAAFQTLAKFATVVKSVVGADRIIVKGDEPGHPFRGNQYEVGSSEIHDWQKADGWQETRAAAPKVLDFIKQAIDQPPFTDTEIKGVIGYVATSRSMNEYLRTGKEPIDNFTKAGIEGVMSAMDKSITKEPMTVFRIMPKAELEATDVGRVVADKGFLSASLFQNRREPDENQVLIQINVPAGTHCIAPLADPKTAPSAYAEEAEVLFPPSTGLRLGGTNPNGNMVFTIDQSTKVTKGDLPGHKFHGNQWTGGNAELAKGAAEYAKSVGLQRPDIDYSKVKVNPSRALEIAKDYVALPSVDESTRAAYREFVKETHQQFEYLTKTLGVKVEVVKEDPYKDAAEMAADVHDNHHLAVLSASSTGGHPFVTNREIEEFRAVHDAFGHAATGRNFDRNGEEAAWASHASMYGPLARQAMTTATRGQNSVMTQLGGGFPEQKGALLPEKWSDPSTVGMSDDVVKSDGDIRPCFAGGRAQYDYQQSDVQKGDLDGHLFHGNQYTSGIQVATFLASALYRRAAKNEPGITKEIAETATEVGAQRIKPDKVLKSADSLARKITLDARDFVGPKSEAEQQASLTVKDSIRYTLALDEKKFSDGVKSALADLRKEGYETIAIRNYFNTDPHNSYKGINGLFRDPIKNQMFEVQFHTPESAAMATKTHGIYKRIRDLNPKDPAYIKGQAKMVKMWAKVSIPAGVEDIGTRSIKASAWTYYEYSTTEGKPFAYYRYDGTDAEAYVEGQWIPASAFLENWIEGNPLLTELDGPPEEAISKGDVPGHQFHGNQWLTVGGGFNTRGGKPSSAAKAPAKAPKAPKVKAPKVPRVPKAPKPVASPPEPKPEPKPKPEPTPPKAETPAPEPEFKSELSPKETAEIRQYVENASKDIPISGQLGDKSQDDARRALFAKNLTMVLCNPGEYNKQFKIAKEQRSNDPANAAILQMLGYGAKPKVVSEEEFAKVPTPCLFSGIKTGSTSVETKMSQLYYGKVPRYGGGFYGAAFYTSPEKYTPVQYTRSGRGGQSCIFRAKLESTSNTWTYDGLAYERPKGISLLPLMKQGITPDQASAYGKIDAVMTDYSMRMSVVPALAGFDALTASQAGTNNDDYTMLLNRGALVLPKNITVGNDIAFFEHTFDEKGARGKGLTDVPVEPYEKSVQKGDVDGHPFHGNQWTGGEGGSEISQAESKPGDNVSVYLNSRKVAEAVEKGLTGTKWDMTVRGDCKAAIAKDIASRLGTKFDEQLIGKWFFGPPEIRHNSMYELQDGQARYVNLYEAGSNQWDKLGPRTSEYDEDGEPIGKPTGEYVRGDDPRVITALREEGVSQLISEWANTSNDTSPLSLAMQQSATKEFGLAGHFDWNYDAAARETLLVPTNSENSTVKDLAEKTKAEVDKLVSEKGDFYRAFLRAQYNATQDYFKAAGIKEVSVYRGMEFSNGTKPDWAKVQIGGSTEIPLRPLSSFAYSLGEAEQFGHTIISGTVPVERVLSCARTGVGCLNEDEIAVMAGPGKWQVGGHRDFSKADLSGVHIKDIASTPDFSGANLEGATFESVLPEARFYNANLKNADFSPSNGKGVVFSSWFGTTFRGANLTGANFQNTHFDYTDFRGANLSGAKLDGAIFNRTESDENTVLPKGYSIVNGELVKQ